MTLGHFWRSAILSVFSIGLPSIAIAAMPSTGPATNPSAGSPPPTSAVRTGTLTLSLDFDGIFTPGDAFALRVKTRNYHDDFIIKKAIAPGIKVAKGDLLLELESDKIDAQLSAAENDLNIAQANLAKAQGDLKLGDQGDAQAMTDSQNALADAQTELKRWDDTDKGAFLKAAGMEASIADYYVDNAADELDQLRKMYKSEDLTSETADIVMKRAVRLLELEKTMAWIAHAAVDRIGQFEAGVRREGLVSSVGQRGLSVGELETTQTQKRALRQTSLVASRLALDEANKKADELKSDRELFAINSPVDGIVVYGSFENNAWHEVQPSHLQAGEKIQPDEVLMTVYAPGKLAMNVQSPEAQILLLAPGSKVTVAPIALPGIRYDGVCQAVDGIGQTAGPLQLFNVPISLPSLDDRLAPGFKADVNFDGGKMEKVLLVPTTAVWRGKVWVLPADKSTNPSDSDDAQPRRVEVGLSDGFNTQIKSGLKAGDVVLTTAKHPAAQAQ